MATKVMIPYENESTASAKLNTQDILYHPNEQQQKELNLNALCPPSHLVKARRLSKNSIQSSSSTPISSNNRQTKLTDQSNSHNSAVSPRFMALRKLSEVTSLPSNVLSTTSVPPVPPIPPIYQQDNSTKEVEFENRILTKIDDILETQLQFHIGQIIWKSAETHMDARKFWEEQKKDMLTFATSLIEKLENQVDLHNRITLDSIQNNEMSQLKELNQKLQEENDQLKQEIQSLKNDNWADIMQSEDEAKKSAEEWANKYKELQSSYFDVCLKLEKDNNGNDFENQLLDLNQSLSKKDQEILKLKEAENHDRNQIEFLQSELEKCQKQLKQKSKNNNRKSAMNRKSLNLSAISSTNSSTTNNTKYTNTTSATNTSTASTNSANVTKQSTNKNTTKNTNNDNNSSLGSGYIAEDGYLIFTTEINGKPSKYSIKIPNV